MRYEVIVIPRVEKELRGIYEYIAFKLCAPKAASEQIKRLENSINSLSNMPFRFKKYKMSQYEERDIHTMIVDNFNVLYIPNKENGTVIIIGVMYAGMDIDRKFR